MKIKQLNETPEELVHFPKEELEARMTAKDIEDVVTIFNTPLVGSYNWDYTEADNRIKKLYELGKELNWNASSNFDWTQNFDKSQAPSRVDLNSLGEWEAYEKLTDAERLDLQWHDLSWTLSQFLHGEQGALLVASQLVSCAPTYNAKLYAASQTFDEARHVEVFNRYLQTKIGFSYPINKNLKLLLDLVLTDRRWDLKFIGMQIVIEGLALAAFNQMKITTLDPLLRDIVHYVIRDEARHVTFGVNYLEEFVHTLTDQERDDRAVFALEACKIMRDRILAVDVYKKFMPQCSTEEIRHKLSNTGEIENFRSLLFTRIMPNLKRIGLLTDIVMPGYEELGLLEYQEAPSDWEINWDSLSKGFESSAEIEAQADADFAAVSGALHD